jgi:hypothetical protein
MKHIRTLALFGAAGSLWISGSQAQTIAKAEIPFDFICQRQVMPRGAYTISIVLERFIELSSRDGKTHVISLIEPDDKVGRPGTKLVFHRYGDRYFLNEFQTETREFGIKLPKSKAEQQAELNEARPHKDETALMSHHP